MSQTNPTITITHRVWVNGEVRWNQWNNRLILDKAGEISEYQAVGRDVTALKATEARLNHLLQELERSNQELEEFASVVSHDLISPLRKQNLLLESLQEDYGAVLDFTLLRLYRLV